MIDSTFKAFFARKVANNKLLYRAIQQAYYIIIIDRSDQEQRITAAAFGVGDRIPSDLTFDLNSPQVNIADC